MSKRAQVLMNIVVAVLLDEFISTVERERSEKKAKRQEDIVSLVDEKRRD